LADVTRIDTWASSSIKVVQAERLDPVAHMENASFEDTLEPHDHIYGSLYALPTSAGVCLVLLPNWLAGNTG